MNTHELLDYLRTELEPEGAAFDLRDLRSAGYIIDGYLDSGEFLIITDWMSKEGETEVGVYESEDEWMGEVNPIFYADHLTPKALVHVLRTYGEDPDAAREEEQIRRRA